MSVRASPYRRPIWFSMFFSISSPFSELKPQNKKLQHAVEPCGRTAGKKTVGPKTAVFRLFPRGKNVLGKTYQKYLKNGQNGVYSDVILVLKMSSSFFFFFFASASFALYLPTEPNCKVIVNAVPPKQKIAHNRPDLWDRGSKLLSRRRGFIGDHADPITLLGLQSCFGL